MAAPTVSPRSLTPARPRRLWLRPAAVAIPIYLAACVVPDGGLFRAARFRDVHLYQGFANAVFDGHVPYRDFFMEYPPGALAVFLPPAAFGSSHYNEAFKCLMAACGVATLFLVATLLVRLGVSATRLWAGVLLFALSPLALGPISLNHYGAWPALCSQLPTGRVSTAPPSYIARVTQSLTTSSVRCPRRWPCSARLLRLSPSSPLRGSTCAGVMIPAGSRSPLPLRSPASSPS